MKLKFNEPMRIDTQTGAIIQVEATRTQMGNKETDARWFCRCSQILMIVATMLHYRPARQKS